MKAHPHAPQEGSPSRLYLFHLSQTPRGVPAYLTKRLELLEATPETGIRVLGGTRAVTAPLVHQTRVSLQIQIMETSRHL